MSLIKNILSHYTSAFKMSFDYKSSACRADLNYFILIYSLLFILLKIVLLFGIMSIVSAYNPEIVDKKFELFFNLMKIGFGLQLLYTVVHFFPFLALIKRRFNSFNLATVLNNSLLTIFVIALVVQYLINAWSFYFGATEYWVLIYFILLLFVIMFILFLGIVKKSVKNDKETEESGN